MATINPDHFNSNVMERNEINSNKMVCPTTNILRHFCHEYIYIFFFIYRINSKARSEGNILRGSTLLIERFTNPGWHHQLKKNKTDQMKFSK